MLEQHFLHFPGIDVIAAGNNEVLPPVQYIKEPVLVHPPQVPGQKPAVLQAFIGFLRLIPVPLHHLRAFHGQFADLPGRHFR
ncbi:hypothetical protein D1872_305550 [compost metagenome]